VWFSSNGAFVDNSSYTYPIIFNLMVIKFRVGGK
jgi:hypothetical protein